MRASNTDRDDEVIVDDAYTEVAKRKQSAGMTA
jgi:hypothetical protein